MSTTTPSDQKPSPLLLIAILAVAAGVVAVILGIVAVSRDDDSSTATTVDETSACVMGAWPPPSQCILPGWKVIAPDGTVYEHIATEPTMTVTVTTTTG